MNPTNPRRRNRPDRTRWQRINAAVDVGVQFFRRNWWWLVPWAFIAGTLSERWKQ
jgi:hypothetical protein